MQPHRCTLRAVLRKPHRCTSRAIWITNTPAIWGSTEYFQPFRQISQQSFDLGSPCTTWFISNALLSCDTQFNCAAWRGVCFAKCNFILLLNLTSSSWVGCCARCLICCGNVLFCQGQSELSWNTCSNGIVWNWMRPPPTLLTLPDLMGSDRHPWPLTLGSLPAVFLPRKSWLL